MNDAFAEELRGLGASREESIGASAIERHGLLEEILAAESVPHSRAVEPRRAVRLRAGLAAAVAVAGLAVVLFAPGDDRLPLSPPDASATLRQFSLALRSQGGPAILGPGDYFFIGTERPGAQGEAWIDRDGTGGSRVWRKKESPGRIKPVRARRPYTFNLGERSLSYAQLFALPRDPGRLLAVTKRDVLGAKGAAQWSGSLAETQEVYRGVTDFLVSMPVPDDLAASFYRVLAKLDYVHLLGPATTLGGSKGIAVGMWLAGGPDVPGEVIAADGSVINERDDLIFDPRSGALIGTRIVLNGEVDFEMALDTGVVDRVGQVPRAQRR